MLGSEIEPLIPVVHLQEDRLAGGRPAVIEEVLLRVEELAPLAAARVDDVEPVMVGLGVDDGVGEALRRRRPAQIRDVMERSRLAQREQLWRRTRDRLLYVYDLLGLEHGAVLDRGVRDELAVEGVLRPADQAHAPRSDRGGHTGQIRQVDEQLCGEASW